MNKPLPTAEDIRALLTGGVDSKPAPPSRAGWSRRKTITVEEHGDCAPPTAAVRWLPTIIAGIAAVIAVAAALVAKFSGGGT